MRSSMHYSIPIVAGLLIMAVAFIIPAPSVEAQCGSQASSCKNCHEVQGQMPVNNIGDWHISHAFGDFCEFCHAGNVQAMEADAAHLGMAEPLADIQASCGACHPADTREKAEVYAVALGVTIGSGAAAGPAAGEPSQGAPEAGGESAPAAIVVLPASAAAQEGVIDYGKRYDETVLGIRQINWGNLTLGGMIAVVAIGGGALVLWNERRLRIAAKPGLKAEGEMKEAALPSIEGVSPEILALLPKIEALNPLGKRALRKLLQDPSTASDLLHRLSRLDPDLLRQLRGLDRGTRSLLLAMVNE